jgi:hypothetical protein
MVRQLMPGMVYDESASTIHAHPATVLRSLRKPLTPMNEEWVKELAVDALTELTGAKDVLVEDRYGLVEPSRPGPARVFPPPASP